MPRLSLSPLLLLLLPACGDPTGAEQPLPVELEFGVHLPAVHPAFSAQGGDGTITMLGVYEALCSPYDASAAATREGNVIVLRVIGRPPGGCFDVVEPVRYRALLGPVPAGRYHLRVVHEWEGTGRAPELVFEKTVDVEVRLASTIRSSLVGGSRSGEPDCQTRWSCTTG